MCVGLARYHKLFCDWLPQNFITINIIIVVYILIVEIDIKVYYL